MIKSLLNYFSVESSDESEKSYEQQKSKLESNHPSEEDLKDTFGTNSGILMQYK